MDLCVDENEDERKESTAIAEELLSTADETAPEGDNAIPFSAKKGTQSTSDVKPKTAEATPEIPAITPTTVASGPSSAPTWHHASNLNRSSQHQGRALLGFLLCVIAGGLCGLLYP